MAARIGIDTGGTFTDIVRWSPSGLLVHKLPSTPADPSQAVLRGLAAVRKRPDEAIDVVHGTTVGLNAVLTGRLARTVFVTNQGCEDLIEIGRQERTDLYALAPSRPVPPVPRALRVGVACRRGPDGKSERVLTARELARVVTAVQRLRPAAIAIGFLHSPVDDTDERRVARALAKALPDVPITTSAELLPVFGEYERFSTAILNAATAPIVGGYTQNLARGIGAGQLRLLRSSLGILPPAEAARFPARAMFSGPAGGVHATTQLAKALHLPRCAAFDMGGTSADLCLVGDSTVVHEHGRIAGLPLALPTVPVHTVGCGGGSIAYRDRGGALRVGPESAGADPGPACFGKGDEPTVTDAHVALGHLGADTLLAGAFPIDVDAAVRAIERLGRRLGLTAVATARGILTVADATMARAILVITAERAVDPSTVSLVAYGGAGGLHAASLARQLRMKGAIVAPWPGAFSAVGLALAGESCERTRALRLTCSPADLRHADSIAAELVHELRGELPRSARAQVTVHVRYRGQGAALVLPLGRNLAGAFAAEHRRMFGFAADAPLELVRITARGASPARRLPANPVPERSTPPREHRRAPLGGSRWPIHHREDVSTLSGPAILEEGTGTTLVPAGWKARTTHFGLVLGH